jgi:hypothetical protein
MTEDIHPVDTATTNAQPSKAGGSHDWNKGHHDVPAGIEENPVDADDKDTGDDIANEDATGSGEMGGGAGHS